MLVAAIITVAALGQMSMDCLQADGTWSPCGPGNDQCGPALTGGPQFHFTERSCGMNDPNGPFYDAKHGIYHLFYQDHLWEPMPDDVPTGREGPVWGHAVSHNMVHWAHVPVGLWNGDGWYDMHGLFTGSATIVDRLGGPVLVFPGVCDLYPPGSAGAAVPGCAYGYAFGMAMPSDPNDPLLRNWSKYANNPIVNDTFDDPSTAWMTPSGEYRMIGHCGDGLYGDCGPSSDFQAAPIWASADFEAWRKVGFTNLPAGECASLFPLPPLVDGTAMPPPSLVDGREVPLTHVHKWGCGWTKDCYALGSWVDGEGSEPGNWTSSPSSPPDALLEHGISYAAKDFWDASLSRRLMWAWAPLYTDSFVLPREVRYDPRLEQLVFAPVAEQPSLRNGTLAKLGATPLDSARPVRLNASAQAEALLTLALPDAPVTFTVNLSAAVARGRASTTASTRQPLLSFQLEYEPASSARAARHRVVGISTAAPDNGRHARAAPASSARRDAANHARMRAGDDPWVFSDELPLLEDESTVSVRLFFDHTIAEVYWQERVAMTLPLSVSDASALEVEVFASQASASLASAHVWSVASMWVSPEQVLGGR